MAGDFHRVQKWPVLAASGCGRHLFVRLCGATIKMSKNVICL